MGAQVGPNPPLGAATPLISRTSGAHSPWLVVWIVALLVVVAGIAFWFLVPHGPNGPPPACQSLDGCGPAVQLYESQHSNASGSWVYDFMVSGDSGLPLDDLRVYVDLPDMETSVIIGTSWTLHALNNSGGQIASFDLAAREWTSGGATPLGSGLILSLDSGTTSLSGGWFFVVGTGSFQGDAGMGIR